MPFFSEGEGPTLAESWGFRACQIKIIPKGFDGVDFELPAQGGGGGSKKIVVRVRTEEGGGQATQDEVDLVKFRVKDHNKFHKTLPYAMGKRSDNPKTQRVIEKVQANVRGRILQTADDIRNNPLIERLYHLHPEFDGMDTTLIE